MSEPTEIEPPSFATLKDRIATSQRKRQSLESMLVQIQRAQAFYPDDVTSIQQVLLAVVQEEQHLRGILTEREQLYQQKLLPLQQTLHQRNQALSHINSTSSAFEYFPELADHFAKRQAELHKVVGTLKSQLEGTWEDPATALGATGHKFGVPAPPGGVEGVTASI